MDPERYRHLTYDVTMAAAKTLARLNPGMVFTYVTGKGTDSTEQGSLRWARVKGKTENDLLKLPFKAAYMFRPSGIQPLHGVRSKTAWINAVYAVTAPLLSWMVRATPNHMTTSEQLGRAMIKVARDGYPKPILESADINTSECASFSPVIPGQPAGLNPECIGTCAATWMFDMKFNRVRASRAPE